MNMDPNTSLDPNSSIPNPVMDAILRTLQTMHEQINHLHHNNQQSKDYGESSQPPPPPPTFSNKFLSLISTIVPKSAVRLSSWTPFL